jgi:hypothetical protein
MHLGELILAETPIQVKDVPGAGIDVSTPMVENGGMRERGEPCPNC